jgi:hypothetical protein
MTGLNALHSMIGLYPLNSLTILNPLSSRTGLTDQNICSGDPCRRFQAKHTVEYSESKPNMSGQTGEKLHILRRCDKQDLPFSGLEGRNAVERGGGGDGEHFWIAEQIGILLSPAVVPPAPTPTMGTFIFLLGSHLEPIGRANPACCDPHGRGGHQAKIINCKVGA